MTTSDGTNATIPEWDLGDRLRKSLRAAGVTVQEIADYLEVNRNTVGNWINGRATPSASTIRLWALRCGVPYDWLRGLDASDNRLRGRDSNPQPSG